MTIHYLLTGRAELRDAVLAVAKNQNDFITAARSGQPSPPEPYAAEGRIVARVLMGAVLAQFLGDTSPRSSGTWGSEIDGFIDTGGVSYHVTPDGERALVVKRTRETPSTKLRFIRNWLGSFGQQEDTAGRQ